LPGQEITSTALRQQRILPDLIITLMPAVIAGTGNHPHSTPAAADTARPGNQSGVIKYCLT